MKTSAKWLMAAGALTGAVAVLSRGGDEEEVSGARIEDDALVRRAQMVSNESDLQRLKILLERRYPRSRTTELPGLKKRLDGALAQMTGDLDRYGAITLDLPMFRLPDDREEAIEQVMLLGERVGMLASWVLRSWQVPHTPLYELGFYLEVLRSYLESDELYEPGLYYPFEWAYGTNGQVKRIQSIEELRALIDQYGSEAVFRFLVVHGPNSTMDNIADAKRSYLNARRVLDAYDDAAAYAQGVR